MICGFDPIEAKLDVVEIRDLVGSVIFNSCVGSSLDSSGRVAVVDRLDHSRRIKCMDDSFPLLEVPKRLNILASLESSWDKRIRYPQGIVPCLIDLDVDV